MPRLPALALCFLACSSSTGGGPGLDPPQVFLTATSATLASTTVNLILNVQGCSKVQDVALYDRATLIKKVVYAGSATEIALIGSDFQALYPTLGIAPHLSLTAKATCDDGRQNSSQAVPIEFLPVESFSEVIPPRVIPEAFIAEGGYAGTKTTFIGCVGSSSGNLLVRVDAEGTILAQNNTLPFPCTNFSNFSDLNAASGRRWMWERDVGAMAFDKNLNVTSFHLGEVKTLMVGPDGDAVLWDSKLPSAIYRIAHTGTAGANFKWNFSPGGSVMTAPQMVGSLNTFAVAVFIDDLGTHSGTIAIESGDYDTGAKSPTRYDLKLLSYPFGDAATIPPCVFHPDGSVLYLASNSANTSSVLACATNAPNCSGSTLRWSSTAMDGQITALTMAAQSGQVAALTSKRAYFYNSSSGALANFGGKAIETTGSLTIWGATAGLAQDFYLLNASATGYPIEVVAIDSAENGELLRYSMATAGNTAAEGLTTAIDEGGNFWLRLGQRIVKPLALNEYRAAKGSNK